MTVAELDQRMTSHELTEWMAFAHVEPFGERRADERAALIAMIVSNRLRSEKEQSRAFEEFMLRTPDDARPIRKSPEELRAKFLLAFPDARQSTAAS